MTKLDIIAKIEDYVSRSGGENSDWYCGISKDAKTRLFTGHSVDKGKGGWAHYPADSSDDAREVEQYFLDEGFDGGPGGGDDDSDMVYVYKKRSYTDP